MGERLWSDLKPRLLIYKSRFSHPSSEYRSASIMVIVKDASRGTGCCVFDEVRNVNTVQILLENFGNIKVTIVWISKVCA